MGPYPYKKCKKDCAPVDRGEWKKFVTHMANKRGSVAKGRGAEETTAHVGRTRESGGAAKLALMSR